MHWPLTPLPCLRLFSQGLVFPVNEEKGSEKYKHLETRRGCGIIVDRNIKGEKTECRNVKNQKRAEILTLFSESSAVDLSEILSCLWKLEWCCHYQVSGESVRSSCMISWSNRPPQHIHVKMTRVTFSLVFLYLSDSLQLGADLQQFLFAVLQPGLESLILMQSFCIHLKRNKMKSLNASCHIFCLRILLLKN